MDGQQVEMPLSDLYHEDETAWLEMMSRLVADRRYEELDHEHLTEYLADMARRDRREVLNRLTTLIAHLLKWEHQPDQRSNSWRATIAVQRQELKVLLESRTLLNYATEILTKAYEGAVRRAALETESAEDSLPAECPMSLDAILGPD
jgi:hypothetical protein